MNRKKELLKSTVLTLLVVISIVLFANSWVSEWTYSDNENLIQHFASAVGIGGFFRGEAEIPDGYDVISPASIIYTSGAKRIIFDKGTDMYDSVYDGILSVLLYASSQYPVETVSAAEWYSAQKTQGIYLDYGINLKRRVLENSIGFTLPDEIDSIGSVVLTSNDSATNKLVMYFHNEKTDEFYKLITPESARVIEKLLSEQEGYENIPLADELGFNTSPGDEIGQQLIIDGNTVINLEQQSMPAAVIVPSEDGFGALDNHRVNSLLSLFGMSKSSAKQYADSSSTMYIDTYGTLRFEEEEAFPAIEFSAANENKGILLPTDSVGGDLLYNIALSGYSKALGVSEIFQLNISSMRLASDLTGTGENGYTLYIDYLSEGNPVFTEENGKAAHAVTVRFNANGEIVYFRQALFGITAQGEEDDILNVLEAVNRVYSELESENNAVNIKKIAKCYKLSGENAAGCWYVVTEADDTIYTIEND